MFLADSLRSFAFKIKPQTPEVLRIRSSNDQNACDFSTTSRFSLKLLGRKQLGSSGETTDRYRWETEYERLWARETAALMIQRCSWRAKVEMYILSCNMLLQSTINRYDNNVHMLLIICIVTEIQGIWMYFDDDEWCVSMECFESSLDLKIFKVVEALYWNGERNVRGWLARTAVRHLETISAFVSRSANQGLKGSSTRDLSWFKYVWH